MSGTPTADEAGRYEIRIEGHLETRWAVWFDGLILTNDGDGTTVISGLVADQSALHGLLHKVRDVGLPLVSVTRVNQPLPPPPATPTTRRMTCPPPPRQPNPLPTNEFR